MGLLGWQVIFGGSRTANRVRSTSLLNIVGPLSYTARAHDKIIVTAGPAVHNARGPRKDALMEVKYAVLSDFVNRTGDGKLNIIGIFDGVRAPAFPFPLPKVYLVLRLEANAVELDRPFPIEIRLNDADGKTLFEMAGMAAMGRLPGAPTFVGPACMDQVIELNGLQFEQPGAHQLAIFLHNALKCSIAIEVSPIPTSA